MPVVSDWVSFGVGLVSGVIGSYLIYATYLAIGTYATKKKLEVFFERFGVLKGVAYYEQLASDCDNAEYKQKLTELTEKYVDLASKHESELDVVVSDYIKSEMSTENEKTE